MATDHLTLCAGCQRKVDLLKDSLEGKEVSQFRITKHRHTEIWRLEEWIKPRWRRGYWKPVNSKHRFYPLPDVSSTYQSILGAERGLKAVIAASSAPDGWDPI